MLRKLVFLLLLIPLGIVLVALAVANRGPVEVIVPPYVNDQPLLAFSIPLFALLFLTLFAGMFIGSCATWIKQGKHRKKARDRKVEATRWHYEADKEKQRAEALAQKVAANDGQTASSAPGLPKPGKAA